MTWKRNLLLSAAAQVDCLPHRVKLQSNISKRVWRGLVRSGLLRATPNGWEITLEGRAVLNHKERKMEGHTVRVLPRYAVAKIADGWAIVDRDKSKIRMHNDVIEVLRSRHAARLKCRALNDGEKHGTEAAQ